MGVRRFLVSVLLAAAAALPLRAATSADDNTVDVRLVLAVDMSSSMDGPEQKIQRDGYVQAFQDPDVQRAIVSGPYGRVAVTYVMWAGGLIQHTLVPWTVLGSRQDAQAFAAELSHIEPLTDRATSISSALLFAADKLGSTVLASERSVIDISGDGANNDGGPVASARQKVLAQGITINGLPILVNPSIVPGFLGLDDYYRECVIGGPGSFVIPIKTLADFAPAIRRKLILEIAWQPQEAGVVPVVDTPASVPKVTCASADRPSITDP